MRAVWRSLHDDLMRSVETITFKKDFDIVRRSSPLLQRFVDHYALLDYLHAPAGDLDDKDHILAFLLVEAQRPGPSGKIAIGLLWLALWPGLDSLYRRLSRYFIRAPEDLVSEIAARFMAAVHAFDRSRVRRVAATILRNTERLIRQALRIEWEWSGRTDPLPDEEMVCRARHQQGNAQTAFGLPPETDTDTTMRMLLRSLVPLIGPDAELVLAVAVVGEPQNEAAARLAISPEAARKRYQRAVARLRTRLEVA